MKLINRNKVGTHINILAKRQEPKFKPRSLGLCWADWKSETFHLLILKTTTITNTTWYWQKLWH